MKKKQLITAVTAALLLALTILFASPAAYSQESLRGQAGIEFAEPGPESSSGSAAPGSLYSYDDDGGNTFVIPNTPVPSGIVTILDPEAPLSGLPLLPQTGGNGAAVTLAFLLISAGGAMLLARKRADRRS